VGRRGTYFVYERCAERQQTLRQKRVALNRCDPKLKTPEAEAPGVSMLGELNSTTGCRVLRLPQRPTSRFRLRSRPLAAPEKNLRLASPARTPARPVADFPGSDRRSVVRLDRWQTSDFRRRYALPFDLRLTFQLSLASFLRQGRGPTFDSHRILILQLGSCPTSGSHRLLLQPSACAVCCCGFWLAPVAARLPNRR